MNQEQQRKIATTSGSAVVVVGILAFLFANGSMTHIPIEARVIAALVIIAVMLVGLRFYFAQHKF